MVGLTQVKDSVRLTFSPLTVDDRPRLDPCVRKFERPGHFQCQVLREQDQRTE